MQLKDHKIRYIVLGVLLFVLCYHFVYSGDDWAWGSSIGIDRLKSGFSMYNGRYLGNLLVLALTRSNILKTVVMSGTFLLIIFLFEKYSEGKWALFFSSGLLLLLPQTVMKQAVVWTSGFTNYTVPTALLLVFGIYVLYTLRTDGKKQSVPVSVGLLFLGLSASLFMENYTIYSIVLSVIVTVIGRLRFKRFFIPYIAYSVGAVAGAVVMFSNGAYGAIADKTDTYRTIAGSGLLSTLKNNYLNTIVPELIMKNNWLNLVLTGVCLVLFIKTKDSWKKNLHKKAASVCISGMICFNVFSFMVEIGQLLRSSSEAFLSVQAMVATAYMICVCVFVLLVGYQYEDIGVVFWLGSIACITAPLLIVTPIGGRCFFITYVYTIGLTVGLIKLCKPKAEELDRLAKRYMSLVCMVGYAFFLIVNYKNYYSEQDRVTYVKNAAEEGQTTIAIPWLPYTDYVHVGEPFSETWLMDRYRLFYGIADGITFVPSENYPGTVE